MGTTSHERSIRVWLESYRFTRGSLAKALKTYAKKHSLKSVTVRYCGKSFTGGAKVYVVRAFLGNVRGLSYSGIRGKRVAVERAIRMGLKNLDRSKKLGV